MNQVTIGRHGVGFHLSLMGRWNGHLMQAYVTQSDDLIGTLTVRETVNFSANMRLSGTLSRAAMNAIVESTIVEMGLQDCADTPIGNWHLRGLSGGERRRVSIGLEILTRPRMLFLDEPTSGLDRFAITRLSPQIPAKIYHLVTHTATESTRIYL